MQLYDELGVPLKTAVPNPLTGTFCRSAFVPGKEALDIVTRDGQPCVSSQVIMGRAQIPYLVTLLVYHSKFQLVAERREYFVYAPGDIQSSVKLAFQLWRRWEKPRRTADAWIEDMRDDYPKVDDGAVSEPIDDACFAEMWKAAQGRKHRCAGDPRDPFAFTCMDPDVMIYKHADFQQGLRLTV